MRYLLLALVALVVTPMVVEAQSLETNYRLMWACDGDQQEPLDRQILMVTSALSENQWLCSIDPVSDAQDNDEQFIITTTGYEGDLWLVLIEPAVNGELVERRQALYGIMQTSAGRMTLCFCQNGFSRPMEISACCNGVNTLSFEVVSGTLVEDAELSEGPVRASK